MATRRRRSTFAKVRSVRPRKRKPLAPGLKRSRTGRTIADPNATRIAKRSAKFANRKGPFRTRAARKSARARATIFAANRPGRKKRQRYGSR